MCHQRSSGKSFKKIPGRKKTERDKWRQMKRVYGMIMSLEISPVLVRSHSGAPGGSRSVGRSSGLRDSGGLGGFCPTGSLIAFIWCPRSKNTSHYVGG